MGLVGSRGSGWTTAIQWLFTCSNQAHVAVRASVVAGSIQTSVKAACHRCSSNPLSSLTSGGSRIERSTRFPWTTSTRSTSVSVRTPMIFCEFMIAFVFSLLIMRRLYEGTWSSACDPFFSLLAALVVSHRPAHVAASCGNYSCRGGQKRQEP